MIGTQGVSCTFDTSYLQFTARETNACAVTTVLKGECGFVVAWSHDAPHFTDTRALPNGCLHTRYPWSRACTKCTAHPGQHLDGNARDRPCARPNRLPFDHTGRIHAWPDRIRDDAPPSFDNRIPNPPPPCCLSPQVRSDTPRCACPSVRTEPHAIIAPDVSLARGPGATDGILRSRWYWDHHTG